MTRRFRLAWSLLLACLLLPLAHAQDSVTAKANLSTGLARLGETVQIQVTVENDNRAEIRGVPQVPGLRFGAVMGPSISSFMESTGGRMVTRSMLRYYPGRSDRGGGVEFARADWAGGQSATSRSRRPPSR
ncbi:MAG: hypothetical protein R3E96_07670 [Planctomycetota bacterium]